MLKAGQLVKSKTAIQTPAVQAPVAQTPAAQPSTSNAYYPACASKYTSIVDALKSIGVDSSYSNRKIIAKANNISNYTGTATQNSTMLNILKQGKLINPSSMGSNSSNVGSSSSSSNGSTSGSTSGGIGCVGVASMFTYIPSITILQQAIWDAHQNSAYFPKYYEGCKSIEEALASIGVDNSQVNIRKIADANNILNYMDTYSHNLSYCTDAQKAEMLTLFESGRLLNSPPLGVTKIGYVQKPNVSVSRKRDENKPLYHNVAGKRSASAYNFIIDQFDVDTNNRYTKQTIDGKTYTYCNIFAWDVMSAMDVELPHWIKNNAPSSSTESGANEINANATYDWLSKYGTNYGWYEVPPEVAQQRANQGYPTIGIYKNLTKNAEGRLRSGHVVVVRPENPYIIDKDNVNGSDGVYNSIEGPVVAQAGSNNFNYGHDTTTFYANNKKYYTHN